MTNKKRDNVSLTIMTCLSSAWNQWTGLIEQKSYLGYLHYSPLAYNFTEAEKTYWRFQLYREVRPKTSQFSISHMDATGQDEQMKLNVSL